MLSRFLFAAAALVLTGCTTLTPAERAQACSSTDWMRYGVNDGKLGVPMSARTEAFTECVEVGEPVDMAAYREGRLEGLVSFCTVENGYRVGYEGRRYARVCPQDLEPDFQQGYERGRKERPAYRVYPSIGIGIGSGGGVRTGIGIGVGSYYGRYGRCGYWYGGCW